MRNKRVTKLVSLMVVLLILVGNISLFADQGSSSMLGTNEALGSPLLNEHFDPEDFDPKEVIIFGIFLSNFPLPLIDSYRTSFSSGVGGSDGYGFRALQFGSGVIDSTLVNMMDHGINLQTTYLKEVYVAYDTIEADGSVIQNTPADHEHANVASFFGGESIGGDKFDFSYGTTTNGNATRTEISGGTIPRFYVQTDNTGNANQTLFDYSDGYDISMLISTISRVTSGISDDKTAEFNSKYKTLTQDDDARLYMDVFGNIVASDTSLGDYVMVFPASASQYLTEKRSHNLVTSSFAGASYLDASPDTYSTKLKGGFGGLTGAISDDGTDNLWRVITGNSNTKYIKPGSILTFFDSDTYYKNVDENSSYGSMLSDLYKSKIQLDNRGKTHLRVEIAGAANISDFPDELNKIAQYGNVLRKGIGDINNTLASIDVLGRVGGDGLSIFGDGVVVPVMANMAEPSTNPNKIDDNKKNHIRRKYMQYLYEVADGKVYITGGVPSSTIISGITRSADITEFKEFVFQSAGNSKVSPTFKSYLESVGVDVSVNDNASKFGGNTNSDDYGRMLKVFPRNETMKIASNILGVSKDGDFAKWTPMIYATYLQWYGLIGRKHNNLNLTLFNIDNYKMDITKIVTHNISDDDLKRSIATYLDPESGRQLRQSMFKNSIADLVYDWYTKTVYSVNDKVGSKSNSNSSGFLSIETYSNNPFTAWFINNYTKIIVPVVGIAIVLLLIVMILKRRGIGWFIIALVSVINAILITPVLGDIVPFVSSNIQNHVFRDRMDFWTISEIVENSRIESDINASKVTGENIGTDVINLVKMFNTQYDDSSLMLRWDISKKVTETQIGNMADIQKYKSTRWLMPMVIRQFSAPDNSADYVYISMTEALDNARNMYWFKNPVDMINETADTMTDSDGENNLTVSARRSLYSNYKDIHTTEASKYSSARKNTDPIHTHFYLLDSLSVPSIDLTKRGDELKDEIDGKVSGSSSSFETASRVMESTGGYYNSWEPSTIKDQFGYMWTTESPLLYFYMTIKDSFNTSDNLGKVVTDLQGLYVDDGDGGDVRMSFMHYEQTGNVKDILDLAEFFNNTMPYIYSAQVVAGGLNGKTGVFGDELIEDYIIYQKNRKSWLFRSNWATKLMESKELSKPDTARDSSGNSHVIDKPILPESYPAGRPMIFSQAEMVESGLDEFDLTKVELRILELNRVVESKWTLLINYANIKGMTKEAMYKQMALIATTEFNKIFSPGGSFKSALSLYPLNIELRNVSFDSVAKMLMLNATRDTGYVYGNTMYNLINNSSITTMILLLLVAFMCVNVMPLSINLLGATLLFLGMYSTISNLTSSGKTKAVNMGAYVVDLLLFIVMNAVFYFGVSGLIGMNSPTDVISTGGGSVIDLRSPTIVLFVLLIMCVVYVWLAIKMIMFLFKNKNDMGAMAMTGVVSELASMVSGGIQSLKDGFNTDSNIGDAWGSSGSTNVSKISSDNASINVVEDDDGEDVYEEPTVINSNSGSSVNYTVTEIYDDNYDSISIQNQIEKGKETQENMVEETLEE